MASDSEEEAIDFVIDQDADLDENEAEYVKMKIQDLKEATCRQRGLSNTGRKQELVDRLGDYDRNGPIWDEIERQIHIPTFRKKSGPRVFLGEDGTPVAYFDLVFTPEIMKLIVEETNRYAEQRLQHPFTAPSSQIRWEPVTIEEMRAFFGCMM